MEIIVSCLFIIIFVVIACVFVIGSVESLIDGEIGEGILFAFIAALAIIGVIAGSISMKEQATEQATEQPQWSDWQETGDSFLLQEVEEDTYVVEQDDGTYICKALTYSSTGETEETYKVVEKNDNTTVKFLDLMEGEKPYGEVLERTSNDETQTMYVFHVPATEN